METKELKLENQNNCLACDAFVVINFAPADSIPESALERVYHVTHGGEIIKLKIVDMLRVFFKDVAGIMTLPATGMEAAEWKEWWLYKHPTTEPETMMGVYYYKRVKN